MNKTIVGVVVAIIIIGGGALALTRGNSGNKNNDSNVSSKPSTAPASASEETITPQTKTDTDQQSSSTMITYTDSGFSPSKITVKSGVQIVIKNNSSQVIQFNSNPHPAHTDNPELNVGEVGAGKSATFTVTTKGNWGYHNHFNRSDVGRIEVD